MKPRARLRRTADSINALSIRERALLLLVALAVIFLAWEITTMRPLGERQEQAQRQLEDVRDRVARLTASIQRLATERAHDPNAELRERQDMLESEISNLQARISDLQGGIAAPRESIAVLAGLLAEETGIRVIDLENLRAEPLEDHAGNEVAGIYVHRVRVVLETDFEGVRSYLERITALPDGVFWDTLVLEVPRWPTNRVELMLYSLAFTDNWLGV
jgi:MSHA biogenesis protein MshJ